MACSYWKRITVWTPGSSSGLGEPPADLAGFRQFADSLAGSERITALLAGGDGASEVDVGLQCATQSPPGLAARAPSLRPRSYGPLLGLLVLVVNVAAGSAHACTYHGAQSGVAGDGADDGAAGCRQAAGQCALLRRVQVRTASQPDTGASQRAEHSSRACIILGVSACCASVRRRGARPSRGREPHAGHLRPSRRHIADSRRPNRRSRS